MKQFYLIFATLSFLATTSSCVKDIVMDANEKPQVVVACILSDDPVQTLNLSFTKGASQAEANPLATATATLYDGGIKVGEFNRQDSGEWTLDYKAIPGHEYNLEVSVPGYGPIHAEQKMPQEPAPIKSARYNLFEGYIEPYSGWIIEKIEIDGLVTRKWPEDEDYPMDETFYIKFNSQDPIWICAMNYNEQDGHHEIAETICTNAIVDKTNTLGWRYEPLSRDVHNPYKLQNTQPRYDFEDTFYSAHLMELYPTLKGKPLYKSFIRFNESSATGFFLSGNFTGEYCQTGVGAWGYADLSSSHMGYILCITPSKDLDKYLNEAYLHQMIQESSDLSTIFLRDNVYSNIEGGLGIFGAQLSRRYPWTPAFSYVDSGITRKDISNPSSFYDPRTNH